MPSRVFDTASGSRHVFENFTARPRITFLLILAVLLPPVMHMESFTARRLLSLTRMIT